MQKAASDAPKAGEEDVKQEELGPAALLELKEAEMNLNDEDAVFKKLRPRNYPIRKL